MSKPPIAIRVRGLHVDYELFEDRRAALRQRFVTGAGAGRRVVRALRGVSFDVRVGESVGVLGTNGSGKSTLLAAIAGLIPTTSGTIEVADEPKLLGVGAALVPGASGRRNVRLGSLALGIPRDDLDEHAEEVIEFTQLGDAIDRPLRTYSSGMKARLHFAIATAVRPKILLIDEALGVGDRNFRLQSDERIRELIDDAGAFMLVNHNMAQLRANCERGLWIEQGKLKMDGPIGEVIEAYEQI